MSDALNVVRLAHERAKQAAEAAQKTALEARLAAERAQAEAEAIDHFLKYRTTFEDIARAAGCRIHIDQNKAAAVFYVPILGDDMLAMMQAFYPTLEQVAKEKADEERQADRRAEAKARAQRLEALLEAEAEDTEGN